MKAAVLRHAGSDLSIEDLAIADPQAQEVLVRIAATGICHSDLSVVRGKVKVELPLVPGHEASGVVERIGSGVSKVKPGDRVILSWAPNCGDCFYCERACPTLCTVYGAAAGAGALWDGTSRLGARGDVHHYSCVSSFAEFAVVPEAGCVALPDHVPFAVGALVGCAVTTGYGAVVNDAAVHAGDSVAVLGIGGVGINALQAASVAGAATVIAIDIDPARADTARTFGASHFIDARTPDAAQQVRALTGGRGVDHSIECSGNAAAVRLAYEATRPAGNIVVVGIAPQGIEFAFPATGFPGSKKRIIGSIYGGGVPEDDIASIFALYGTGKLALDAQIGARITLPQVNDALRAMERGIPGRSIILFD
jgi:Zn-dependent alcohol dehydrogenase